VDWYLEGSDSAAASRLREEISGYLSRHAADDSAISDAELITSELLANGLRHAAGPLWVTVSWTGVHPELTVADLGPGFELDPSLPSNPLSVGGRGLFIVDHLALRFEAAARRGGGSVVTAALPVLRVPSPDLDPPLRSDGALPALDEADAAGGFGKEAFLRALVVQLAQGIERDHGPRAAESAVSQVGADVGGQMEREFRHARSVVGRMSPEQIAACLVRLKHAIDGGFSVESCDDERIVLVNDRCPFGDTVRRAPALCRMTSSVFGGIAARNSDDGALVVLEERIAVGDPGCRVVVWLTDERPDAESFGHRYRPPSQPSDAGEGSTPGAG
jgi:anti-sigma regulatory factor (Ser/Thr protein kinase)